LELLESGDSYEVVAERLGIPAGLAFMIATGSPADGSELASAGDSRVAGSTQTLVNPPAHNPTRKECVLEWVKMRAERDLAPPS
jgi:hypothetical protein